MRRRIVMTVQTVRAPTRAVADAATRAQRIERALARFRPKVQNHVRAVAARHPWIADLAVSFPALSFALAFPRAPDAGIVLMVTSGAPLARIADALGVPMWLRAFPPQAFDTTPIPPLPDSPAFRRRIANHPPRRWKDAPAWMQHVHNSWRWGDEDIALWFAREAPIKVKQPRWSRMPLEVPWRIIVLWAWYSQRRETRARAFIDTLWTPSMQWSAASQAAADWRAAMTLPLHLTERGIEDVWLRPGTVDGFTFTPIRTAGELDAEAHAMSHCVRTYAVDIASNTYRVWSMRKHGERVATLALTQAQRQAPLASIFELAGPRNAPAPIEAWRAARKWIVSQDDAPIDFDALELAPASLDAALWRKLWRPYWLAKRAIPTWLPLTPESRALYNL